MRHQTELTDNDVSLMGPWFTVEKAPTDIYWQKSLLIDTSLLNLSMHDKVNRKPVVMDN